MADKYRIDALLGRGGMGQVWRATHLSLGRAVAIKVLHARYSVDEDSRKRFEREAKVSAAFHHPGAVNVFDFGEDHGHLYLVMELLLGQTLNDYFRKSLNIYLSDFIEIALGLLDTLEAAHDISLVHRDLKPDNIFIAREESSRGSFIQTKIVDFGLAFIEDQGDLGRMTQTGMITGTPEYLSAEQAGGKELTPASDLYSLAIIFYEILTGDIPFHGSVGELLSQHIYTPAPRMRSIQPQIPYILDEMVALMLSKEASRRPRIADIKTALKTLSVQLKPSENTNGKAPAPAPTVDNYQHPRQERATLSRRERTLMPFHLKDLETDNTLIEIPFNNSEDVADAKVGIEIAILDADYYQKLSIPLSTQSFSIVRQVSEKTAVVFIPGATEDQLEDLIQKDYIVITDALSTNMQVTAKLLQLGVHDLVFRPLQIEDIMSAIQSAAEHHVRQ